MARLPLSDKMVNDAVDEHDLWAEGYLCGKFSLRVQVCGIEIDADTIDVREDLAFNRIRNANYGDHFRERVRVLDTK